METRLMEMTVMLTPFFLGFILGWFFGWFFGQRQIYDRIWGRKQ